VRTVSIAPTILNSKAFMPFGDVVSMEGNQSEYMNDTFSRYSNLAEVDLGDEILSRVNIGLAKCNAPKIYPYELTYMEKHPQSSQMFFPLFDHEYLVAVAPPGDVVHEKDIRLFIVSPMQGINYRPNIWHMPMLGIAKEDSFLMVERSDMHLNCELYVFPDFKIEIELPLSIKRHLGKVDSAGDDNDKK